MTLEIDCTTRTKQKSIVHRNSLSDASSDAHQTDTCTKSVISIVRTVRVIWKLAATACEVHWKTGPVWPTRPRARGLVMAMLSQYWEYVGSYNSQSALGQYSVLLSAPFLVTVVYSRGTWAVSKDCSDCGMKANSLNIAKAWHGESCT